MRNKKRPRSGRVFVRYSALVAGLARGSGFGFVHAQRATAKAEVIQGFNGGIGIAHPDALTCGGILETKKLGDLAQTYGVRMALHQAATPIHAMAAAHIGVATENCWACEFHANDVPWWDDLIISRMRKPLIQNGFIEVPDLPGLGIDDMNDEVIAEHISQLHPGVWEPTDEWNHEYSVDAIYN